MEFLYVLAAAVTAVVVWRISHPGDMRINRTLIGRYVKDSQGRGPTSIRMTKLLVDLKPGQPEERAFFDVVAEYKGGKRDLLVQVFYPLEALQQKRDQEKKDNAQTFDPMAGGTTMGDSLAYLKEDRFKDLAKEEKVTEQKRAMISSEIDLLKTVGQFGVLFPKLIAHDSKRFITLTEGVGNQRLDELLHTDASKVNVLTSVLTDIARFHDRGMPIRYSLEPGVGHSEQQIKQGITSSFSAWGAVGVKFEQTEALEVMDALQPIIATSLIEPGPRLEDASPRSFFMHDGVARRVNWGGVRLDISAFDVVELVCDPAVGLSAEQELELFRHYAQSRELSETERATLYTELVRLAVYFRLVLLGFLITYVQGIREAKTDRKKPAGIKYWDAKAVPQAIENVLAQMRSDQQLVKLANLLDGKLKAIASWE